ncbi:4054_t:CDS:10 [Diversispora eburnea]|uniref:4054_t:CDS:1 n=1 Tax=Diversispora eburnea TaxID=1213867 RepID=A0A9N8ZZI4_9GLOM|nr:4054_t:CDS:10 [Diversispora eburnea]
MLSMPIIDVLQPSEGEQQQGRQHIPFDDIVRENEAFVNYYKIQNIISDETEWNKFLEVIKITLPTSFRITGSRSQAFELRDLMKNEYVPKLNKIQFGDDKRCEAPKPLLWYPDELAWQHSAPRSIIKKEPEFQSFHKCRQEAVSMTPPLFLDVKPDHWVLDMCAAPGSKTTQILEAIHINDTHTGIVIANDADAKRSHMLVHQAKRLKSPCLMVTNHDAVQFPGIYVQQDTFGKLKPIQFDHGTLRKNYIIWKNWGIGNAIVKILLRGAQLVKENGRIVYSTCSLNPLENEAVIAEVLRRCRGNLQLVDVSDQLPELKRAPGLTTWKVMNKENRWVDKLEDINPRYRKKYEKSLWPPPNVNELNLERCIRIYPHFQDTGGFFIAILQKTGPITDISDFNISNNDDNINNDNNIININDNIIDNDNIISNDINNDGQKDFPFNQLLVRSTNEKNKTIYLVSESVKRVLEASDSKRLRIVNTGIRTFTRQEVNNEIKFIKFGLDDLKTLLSEPTPLIESFSDNIKEKLNQLDIGCIVIYIEHGKGLDKIILPVWRAAVSLNLLYRKEERKALELRIQRYIQRTTSATITKDNEVDI